MLRKYISILLVLSLALHACDCPQLAPYCEQENSCEDACDATKACSKTYNNLVVTNALRTSNLNVTSATTLAGPVTTSGAFSIAGPLSVTGSLMVNGLPVQGGLAAFGSFTNIDPVDASGIDENVPFGNANPANMGFIMTSSGMITIQNPGTYLYNYGIVLQGAGSSSDEVANATLMLNGSPVSPTGVTSFTIPANTDPSTMFTQAPYQLTSSGLLMTTMANAQLALSVNFTPSWSMPTAGNGSNAYITLIQVN